MQAGEERHERRLAGTRVADDGDELPLLDFERDVLEHLGSLRLWSETLGDAFDFEKNHDLRRF